VNLADLTFLSLVFWAFVIGPIGALLAVPLTLLMKARCSTPTAPWISSPLEGGPPPPRTTTPPRHHDTPDHTTETPADRIAAARTGGRPPQARSEAHPARPENSAREDELTACRSPDKRRRSWHPHRRPVDLYIAA
jgi:hypothetical protein